MKPNLGPYDIAIRLGVGAGLFILLWVKEIEFPLNWLLLFISFLLVMTGLSGSCPFYWVFNISTRPSRKASHTHRNATAADHA